MMNAIGAMGAMFGGGRKLQGWGLFMMGLIVTLGEWSEAIDLITLGVETTRSQFTNSVEYERLDHLHVGNSVQYVEGIIGSPEVIRNIDEGLTANYFFDRKYLLTLFYKEGRVTALTILARREDFHYTFGDDHQLLTEPFSNFPRPKSYSVDHANTGSYYVESLSLGRVGMFLTQFLGIVDYGGKESSEIPRLYDAEVRGETRQIENRLKALRTNQVPNFYGEGELPLAALQKSLLTPVEFNYYTR